MVEICETILFEAQQSGSMDSSEILAGAKLLDGIGYRAIEVMPPAAEIDDWGQINQIREVAKSTPLLISIDMDAMPEASLEHFIKSGAANGVEIFRVYHRTNNLSSLERVINVITKAGKSAECTVIYSQGQDPASLANFCKAFKNWGCFRLCLSGPSEIMMPQKAIELVTLLKKETDASIALRISSTTEMAGIAYYAAVGAGLDSLYCVLLCPHYERQCLPRTKVLALALSGSEWAPDLTFDLLGEAGQHFQKIGAHGPRAYEVDISGSRYHVVVHPSGMQGGGEKGPQVSPVVLHSRPRSVPRRAGPRITCKREAAAIKPSPTETSVETGIKKVPSTMEGTIMKIVVKPSDSVKRKDRLVLLEAMKMQNEVLSPVDGVVEKILVLEGETVKDGQDLVTIRISG